MYKGILRDGSVVAVKRLKDGNAVGGDHQFQTEVEMISLAVHRNLLRLTGFCMTATERLLVYPYMSNGSVASRLKGLLVLGGFFACRYKHREIFIKLMFEICLPLQPNQHWIGQQERGLHWEQQEVCYICTSNVTPR